jgi:hypothetical protein
MAISRRKGSCYDMEGVAPEKVDALNNSRRMHLTDTRKKLNDDSNTEKEEMSA